VKIAAIMAAKKSLFDEFLRDYLSGFDKGSGLQSACAYSLSAGGKRLRPVLTMLACEAVGGAAEQALAAALAVEMIHTFSLIHDDLPAIDNDDMRRGMATCHKAFGEATAILAGDALIFQAFALIGSSGYGADVQMDLSRKMAENCGLRGLIEGEYADIMAEGQDLRLEDIERIYWKKTGRLFELCLFAGGRVAGADRAQLTALEHFGAHLGLAFQAVDDILDVTSNVEALGKTPGKDALQDKATIVKAVGLERAKAWAGQETARAVAALDGFTNAGTLVDLAHELLDRVK